MVIETEGSVIYLSGSLRTNQWLTVKAAAHLILRDTPQGSILLDCAGLSAISPAGRETFADALREIETARFPLRLANLPEHVQAQLESGPEGRCSTPLTETPEAARIMQAISSAEWWERLLGTRQGDWNVGR